MRAALAALLFAGTAAHAEGAAWTELRTAHFVVRTDLSADDARKYVVELEHMRDALFRGSWHGPTPPSGRMLVTLLADRSEMAEFASSTFAGFAAANAFGERMLVFSADRNPSELPVLKHELAHWLNGAFLLRQPRWLNEGLACYLETARTNSAEGTVVIGEPDPKRRDHLLTFPTDYARVLATGRELFMAPKEEVRDFYAASWLLVHWLADEQRPRFNQYLGRLAKAQEPKAAWNAVFPELDGARLDKDIHAYLMRRRFGIGRIAAPPWEGPVEARPLDPAELHAQRASLIAISFGMKRDDALKARILAEAQEALKLDPANALALAVAFGLSRPEPAEVLARARSAAQAHPDDPRAHLLLANVLSGEATHDDERRAALERAVRLAPEDATALNNLAWYHVTHGHPADGLPLAFRSVQISPGNPFRLDTLAAALAGVGRCAEALHAEERVFEVASDGVSPQALQSLRKNEEKIRQTCAAPEAK